MDVERENDRPDVRFVGRMPFPRRMEMDAPGHPLSIPYVSNQREIELFQYVLILAFAEMRRVFFRRRNGNTPNHFTTAIRNPS